MLVIFTKNREKEYNLTIIIFLKNITVKLILRKRGGRGQASNCNLQPYKFCDLLEMLPNTPCAIGRENCQ